jgi:hypothetical protein
VREKISLLSVPYDILAQGTPRASAVLESAEDRCCHHYLISLLHQWYRRHGHQVVRRCLMAGGGKQRFVQAPKLVVLFCRLKRLNISRWVCSLEYQQHRAAARSLGRSKACIIFSFLSNAPKLGWRTFAFYAPWLEYLQLFGLLRSPRDTWSMMSHNIDHLEGSRKLFDKELFSKDYYNSGVELLYPPEKWICIEAAVLKLFVLNFTQPK